MGIRMLRARVKSIEIEGIDEPSWLSNFLCGLFITLGAPRAILFYVSFLPAYSDLTKAGLMEILWIMVIATLAVGVAKLVYAFLAHKSRELMHPGSVMAPTMNRMCYLTLRGISVARILTAMTERHAVRVVEVHPGGSMALGGAPVDLIKDMKTDSKARIDLQHWMETQGMQGLATDISLSDHLMAAAAAALATWRWQDRRPNWLHAAAAPLHPFDFAC